jgi:anti-sigma-K factor RskA
MSTDRHVQDLLPAYVVGALDPDDAKRVDEHVMACGLCRQELNAFAVAADEIALWAPEVEPSREVKERLMQRVRSMRPDPAPARRLWRDRLLPAWGLASLVLSVSLLAFNVVLWQRLQRLESITAPGGMRAIALAASETLPDASGFVIVGADGRNGVLVVDRLPALPDDQQYQVWLRRDGELASGALFSTDETGYRGLRLEAPRSLFEYAALEVTIEPAEGSAQPTGPRVLGGRLFGP